MAKRSNCIIKTILFYFFNFIKNITHIKCTFLQYKSVEELYKWDLVRFFEQFIIFLSLLNN